jgi:hypothetical protein
LGNYNIEALAVTSLEQAKELGFDLVLRSNIIRVKQASKVGGLLKAVRNIDPSATGAYNIEAQFILSNLKDGTIRLEKGVDGKFEGTSNSALKKAFGQGTEMLADELRN